jgi:hypothetical protein
MNKFLHCLIAVTASFALAAIGIGAVETAAAVREARANIASTSLYVQKALTHVDATVTDLDRTVQIAGGAIGEARKIERDNRGELAAVNRATLATLQHVDGLVVSFDTSQHQASMAIQQTSAALVPVIAQTEVDLRELRPAIAQMTPLLQQSTAVAANLNDATADVEHEIHKLVYPPPRKWWQRYLLDPLKTAAHLVTIPLGHL